MANGPHSGPHKPPDPRDVFNQRTADMRANADGIIAGTIARINANPNLKRGFDLMQQMGFPAAELVALVHFESSGGLLTNGKKSNAKPQGSAEGDFQFTEETFYDDTRRFFSPQNPNAAQSIQNLRAVAPDVANDFERAAGGVTIKTDPITKEKYTDVTPEADAILSKYRKDDFVHMYFISENVRIHQGQAAGNLENLRLMHNWGVVGMNRILDANPDQKMNEIFKPAETDALKRNNIPPNLTVRDFLAQEKELYKFFVARAQVQLNSPGANVAANTPPSAMPTATPPPPASPPQLVPPPAAAPPLPPEHYTVVHQGNLETIHFADPSDPAAVAGQAGTEGAGAPLPPPAPTIPSRTGATVRPPPTQANAAPHPHAKEPQKSKAQRPAHAEPHRPGPQSITGIIANNFR